MASVKTKEKKDRVVSNTKNNIDKNSPSMINSNHGYAQAVEANHGVELTRILKHLDKYKGVHGKPKFKTPEEMELVIETWWNDCMAKGLYPTKRGLALALGTTYDRLSEWRKGSRGSAYSSVIKNVDELIAEVDEQLVMDGVINPVLYMFRSKNYHGLRDKVEHSVETTAVEYMKTREELETEYIDAIPEKID